MFYPDFETVSELAKNYDKIPLTLEVYADFRTPISLLHAIRQTESRSFLLESVEGGENWARYSFIGFDPQAVLTCKDGETFLECGGEKSRQDGNPFDCIKEIMAKRRMPTFENLPRLLGGAVGYFGYESVGYTEEIKFCKPNEMDTPDILLMFFDKIIAFDHLKQKIDIIVNIDAHEHDLKLAYVEAKKKIQEIYESLRTEQGIPDVREEQESVLDNGVSTAAFSDMVEKAQEYIRAGDVFQVVLSSRMQTEMKGSLFSAYRAMRTLNPSPYMYYICMDDLEIAGASPETLVRVTGDAVTTFPIAGTRRRGKNAVEDQLLEGDLLSDEKELAEHNMLVDLARNDIGKVCNFGSVQLTDYQKIQRFSHVMHMTTQVSGKLHPKCHPIDALRSILPAGTLSGAPKIRAMEIIEELEPCRRGIYGGGIGYIGYDGSIDVCITIRTIVKKGNVAYIQAGAGIVLDSKPESERVEIENKSGAMLAAIREGGKIL